MGLLCDTVSILNRACNILADTILIILTWKSLCGRQIIPSSRLVTKKSLMEVIFRDGLSSCMSVSNKSSQTTSRNDLFPVGYIC